MREMGLLAPKVGINYTLLGDDGEVTGGALKQAGISANRRAEVQDIIDNLWNDMSSEMSKRVVLDSKESNPGEAVRVYRLAADRSYAEDRLRQFKDALGNKFGKKEGEILYDGMGSVNYFGWFGKLDLKVRFADVKYGDGRTVRQVAFSGKDPDSGKEITGGSFAADAYLRRFFGTTFDKAESGN